MLVLQDKFIHLGIQFSFKHCSKIILDAYKTKKT